MSSHRHNPRDRAEPSGRLPGRRSGVHPRRRLAADDADRGGPPGRGLADDDLPHLVGHAGAARRPDDPRVGRAGGVDPADARRRRDRRSRTRPDRRRRAARGDRAARERAVRADRGARPRADPPLPAGPPRPLAGADPRPAGRGDRGRPGDRHGPQGQPRGAGPRRRPRGARVRPVRAHDGRRRRLLRRARRGAAAPRHPITDPCQTSEGDAR